MPAITRAELSRRLGVSRAAVTLAIKDGRLEPALLPDGKVDAALGVELFRATSRRAVVEELPVADAAAWANALLDVECWGPPPWSRAQWVDLAHVLEFATALAAEGRVYSPAALHALGIELDEQIQADGRTGEEESPAA